LEPGKPPEKFEGTENVRTGTLLKWLPTLAGVSMPPRDHIEKGMTGRQAKV
jgi:hypothetical protein